MPLNALVKWKPPLAHRTVNHVNQFPSVTFYFSLNPGVAMGDATDFITKTAAEDRAIDHASDFSGRGSRRSGTRSEI